MTTYENPVGAFNRYRYANSNPYRFKDPDGRAAIVTTNKDGSIDINIPAKFKGDAASSENIGKLQGQVAALSGKYKIGGKETQVNFRLTHSDKTTPRAARNEITLRSGPTDRANGLSYATTKSPFSTNISVAKIDIKDRFVDRGVGAHEVLHLAGMDDRKRPEHHDWDGNIMRTVPGQLESRNFGDIMSDPHNIFVGPK